MFLLGLSGCGSHCTDEVDILWPPSINEYRLNLTNRTPHMVELFVDGESVGVFCSGVETLAIGNFPKNACSEIRAEYFDNPDSISLDDCIIGVEDCKQNNTKGRICFDTRAPFDVDAILE